jgi:hypothetical protein
MAINQPIEMTITPPDAAELVEYSAQTTELVAEFGQVQITTPTQYQRAADLLRDAATLLQKITKTCEPTIKAAHAAHKAATTMRAELCAPIDAAVSTLKQNMAAFQRAEKEREERERREAEELRRRHEEQQRAARMEADRLVAEAEAAARHAEVSQDALDALTAEIEADAAAEAANAALDRIEECAVSPYVQVNAAAKATGVSSATVYRWRVVDKSLVPPSYWTINEKAIDAFVRVAKATTDIPGIEVYTEESIRVSARK